MRRANIGFVEVAGGIGLMVPRLTDLRNSFSR